MNLAPENVFRNLFHPRSIAVIGAGNNPMKPGGRVIRNLVDNGFGGRLYAVNARDIDVMGLPTFASAADLPEGPDLALIIVPAGAVLGALTDLAAQNTKAAMIMTAGFGEKGEEGKKEEEKLLRIARDAGMALIGPNCSGFLTPHYAGKFAGIMPKVRPGAIDFISGSGATVDYFMEQAVPRGLTFSNVINLGNSIQLGVEDMVELFDLNHGSDSAQIMLLYLEQIKQPEKLLRHARSLTSKGCQLVGIKSGATDAGAKAAVSHTGAMATPDRAVQALFDKAGIIRVQSKTELLDVAAALVAARGPIKGRRIGIITDAGGPGVMLADELGRQGLIVPELNLKTRKRLSNLLPPEAALANPVDCLPTRSAEQIRDVFRILAEEESEFLDVLVLILGNAGMSDNRAVFQETIQAMDINPVPVLPVFSSVTTLAELISGAVAAGKPYFTDEVAVGRALGKIVNRPILSEPPEQIPGFDRTRIGGAIRSRTGALPPEAVQEILIAAGFNLPPQAIIRSERDLAEVCGGIGFPVALKVIGPLHKTDVGGVKIGLQNLEQAGSAYRELMAIPEASGVLVQKMVAGVEVILGAKREQGFGHLIMFGLGGIYTEVLKDVSFALGPLSHEEALYMIQGIRALPILKGVRGEPGADLNLLADHLARLGLLVSEFPQIGEIDLNPIKGTGRDLFVVDARILLDA